MSGGSPGVLTLHPYPVPLPPISARAYTYICMRKAPGSSPIRGQEAEGFHTLFAIAEAAVMPWVLRSGEHRCGCGQFGAGHECGAEGCELACVAFGYTEQGQQLGGRVGHDGLQQQGDLAYDLKGYVQHGVHAVEFAVLAQGPGFLFCEVGVGVCEDGPDALECAVECLLVEVCTDGLVEGCRLVEDLAVGFGEFAVGGDGTAAVLGDHGQGTLGEVAEVVCQVGVDAVDDGLFGVGAVLTEGHFTHEEESYGVHTERVDKVCGVDNVTDGLGHLLAVDEQEAVVEDALGQFDSGGPQECVPVDGVESGDVLTDEVQVGGQYLVNSSLSVSG